MHALQATELLKMRNAIVIALMLTFTIAGRGIADNNSETKTAVKTEVQKYLDGVHARIKKDWFPVRGQESKVIVAVFKIHQDGSVSDFKVRRSNASKTANESTWYAVKNSLPFAKLPTDLGSEIGVQYVFSSKVFLQGQHPATQYDVTKNSRSTFEY